MSRRFLLLGPPGCGKTTRILKELDRVLRKGVDPRRVAFVSFTRNAVQEGKQRACQLLQVVPDELPYFRTLHSMCFYSLGLRRGDVFGDESLDHLADVTREEIRGKKDLDVQTLSSKGDLMLHMDHLARNTNRSVADVWHEHTTSDVAWPRLERFRSAYLAMRQERGESDFTDMLQRFRGPIDVDYAFVDEAQDLTPLQWAVVELAFCRVQELWVAGDDDQSLFGWAGATANAMLAFDGQREVLSQSYRVPASHHEVANAVIHQVANRIPKEWNPRKTDGRLEIYPDPNYVDLSVPGTWLLLARTRHQLKELVHMARDQTVPYTVMGKPGIDSDTVRAIVSWGMLQRGQGVSEGSARRVWRAIGNTSPVQLAEDPRYNTAQTMGLDTSGFWYDRFTTINVNEKYYIRGCIRRGGSVTAAPKVRIETIHGAKGSEADNVLLMTGVTRKIQKAMELDMDSERRVAYVALTRAKERLYLIEPPDTNKMPIWGLHL